MVRTTTNTPTPKKKKQFIRENKPAQSSNLGGRPKKEINYKLLKSLCKILCTVEECCAVLGMCYDTLDARLKEDGHVGFSVYYKKHSANGRASLRRLQWKSAQAGNTTMQIWLGKQMLGQRDQRQTALTGPHGGPVEVETEDKTLRELLKKHGGEVISVIRRATFNSEEGIGSGRPVELDSSLQANRLQALQD